LKSAFAFDSGGTTNIYRPISQPQLAVTPTGNLNSPLTTEKTDLASFAVADTMSFMQDRILLTLGARQQQVKDKTYDTATGAQTASYDEDAITPLVAFVFKATEHISLYANYAESLTKGPIAAAFGTPPTNVGQAFAPTKTKQKEIGLKYDGGSVGATLAYFTVDQPLSIIENNVFSVDGKQRNKGVELTVFGAPAKNVRVLGGVTLMDSEQVRTANGVNQGKDAIGVPDTQLNLGGEWDVPGMERLTLTSRVLYTSSQFMDSANEQEVPSWTRVDVGARYRVDMGTKLLTLRAGIENLMGRDYWASVGGFPGSGYLVLGNPRTYTVTATVDF
jgi:iron complex outermembrane receptor protein